MNARNTVSDIKGKGIIVSKPSPVKTVVGWRARLTGKFLFGVAVSVVATGVVTGIGYIARLVNF